MLVHLRLIGQLSEMKQLFSSPVKFENWVVTVRYEIEDTLKRIVVKY